MADKKITPKIVEPKVVNPKFETESDLVQYLKNTGSLTPAAKQKLLDDFRKK